MGIEIDAFDRVEENKSVDEFDIGQAHDPEIGEDSISPNSPSEGKQVALRQVDSIIKDMAESYERKAGVLRTLDRIAGKL